MNRIKTVLHTALDADVNLMLWGGAGIGKTSVINQVAEEYRVRKGLKKFRAITLVLSQMDSIEIGGFPKVIGERAVNLKPWWFPLNDDDPVLLFLDELNRADKFAINAVHQLALEKRINIHVLPPGSRIVAACNYDDETETGLTRFGDAFIERFAHVEVNHHLGAYLDYTKKANPIPEVDGFIEANPAFLCKHKSNFPEVMKRVKPSPRCWDFVKKVASACGNDLSKLEESGYPIIAGTVGSEPAQAYMKWVREQFERPLKYAELTNGKPETRKKIEKWCNEGKIELLKTTLEDAIVAIENKYKNKDLEKMKEKLTEEVRPFFEIIEIFPKDTSISVFSGILPDSAKAFGKVIENIPVELYKKILDFERDAKAEGQKEKAKKVK